MKLIATSRVELILTIHFLPIFAVNLDPESC